MLKTFYSIAVVGIVTVICGTLALIFSALSLKDMMFAYAIKPWGYYILRLCGVRIELEGAENLPKEPCVIMYNHQSSADIYAFTGALPIHWRPVLKKELRGVPFVGWVTRAIGSHFVERDGSGRDTQEVRKMAEAIKRGPSVLIAPEGTRSPDGKLLPFKKGGFLIASLAKVPIVPLMILGGRHIMPKGSLRIKSGVMKVRVLPPVDVRDFSSGKEGREELIRAVREAMERALAEYEEGERAAV
ncbi:MAG: lysophospholipid acyltransferase family protein [Deltaproteobacteria bacterium]